MQDRAAIGLGGVFRHLGRRLNFHRVFEAVEAVIADFSLAAVASARLALSPLWLSRPQSGGGKSRCRRLLEGADILSWACRAPRTTCRATSSSSNIPPSANRPS